MSTISLVYNSRYGMDNLFSDLETTSSLSPKPEPFARIATADLPGITIALNSEFI